MSGVAAENTVRVPVNAQRWSAISFLHWPVDPEVVQSLLPSGLHVQTHSGSAWIGLTPFLMRDVRVPPFPPLPGWSTFPEVNLRTYVRHDDGTDGLWFLMLWSTRRAVNVAMRVVGLPYQRMRARVLPGEPGTLAYEARPAPQAVPLRLSATVRAGDRIAAPSDLEVWLTGRWNAYVERAGRVWRVPVTHEPWPLRRASVTSLDTDVFAVMGLPVPAVEPLVHVSPGVSTRIGIPRPAPRR
ncbi:YqjF family protein [Cellulomonas sp. P22]|uniref:YqjF family protein n=1 Tax=Cellulomonas sp. P22 TaxID=3373189 RepID=UPI00379EBE23